MDRLSLVVGWILEIRVLFFYEHSLQLALFVSNKWMGV